ncbi:MAG: hypothetical protein KDA42_06150 [Planctomycetales bacterium]|nr:hypothetical protein [Planctomycetales bacterium]
MTEASKPDAISLEGWFDPKDHPTFFDSFTDDERAEMLTEDLAAGRSVPALLTAVITMGVVLAASSVLLML